METQISGASLKRSGFICSLNEDGTSYILVLLTGFSGLRFEICIDGVFTNKAISSISQGLYNLRFRRDGREIWIWYNDVLIGAGPTTTLSEAEDTALRGVKAGLFSTSELNSFDNFTCIPTGTNGEHNALGPIIGDY